MKKLLLLFLFIPLLSFSQDEYLWQTKDHIRENERRIHSTQDKFVDSMYWEILGRTIEGSFHYEYDTGCVLRCTRYFITRRLIDENDELISLLEDTTNVGLQMILHGVNVDWLPEGSEVKWMMGYLTGYVEIEGEWKGFMLTRALYKYKEQWFIIERGTII